MNTQAPRRSRRTELSAPRHWVVVAVVLYILVLAIGFATKYLTGFARQEFTLDQQINMVHSPLLDQLADALDKLDHPIVVAVIILIVLIVVGLLSSWTRAIGVALVTGLGWITVIAIKLVVQQPRPTGFTLAHPIPIAPETLSYPSGHVAFIAALATALLALVGRRAALVPALILFVVLTLIVGWSRLYLGIHYPSDVVGGALNGVAGAILFLGLWNLVMRGISRRRSR